MKTTSFLGIVLFTCLAFLSVSAEDASLPKAFIDGNGPGWRALGEQDFVNVNCAPDTWSFKDGQIQCTGVPTGVMRTKDQYTNFELVVEWKHLKPAGNSGVFVWGTEESIKELAAEGSRRRLPTGIEVQILDHGYKENYLQKNKGKKTGELFFSTNGDVFPTGTTKLTPFPPTSPNGQRSFPRKELSKGAGQWNHYYVRAINGEVRLWVNGEEVSGGKDANPASGYLCLESEGSPIEFKNLRIRLLP
jgi:3-keto-disaccharide hydrolase